MQLLERRSLRNCGRRLIRFGGGPNPSFSGEEKPPEPAKKPRPKEYSRHTPVPSLKRDPFETVAEYQDRMKGYQDRTKGSAGFGRECNPAQG